MGKKKEWISRCSQSVECSICSIEKLYLLKLWKCICRGPAAVRSSQWTAAVQIFQLSWWWQQFPTGGSSSKAQLLPQCRLKSPILLLSLCLASVVAAVAIALLCCQWRHQCWQWLQSWRSSIVWELAKEFRAVKVQTCETMNKKCQISLTVTCHDKRKAS